MQRLSSSQMAESFPWFYLSALAVGYVGLGWLLAAFHVFWLVWLGTFLIVLYLTKSGPDGIVVGSAWVVGLMSIGAVMKAWPAIWNIDVPDDEPRLWAASLLVLWVLAIALVCLLAFAPSSMRSLLHYSRTYTTYSLTGIIWAALGAGWLVYQWMR